MKKTRPLILALIFIAVATIGIIGFARKQREGFDRPAVENGGRFAAGGNATTYDLLKVGTPASLKSQEKDYEGFRVSFNSDNGTPNWVSWELLRSETTGAQSRYNKFWQDPELDGCPSTEDYTHSGYDRGHLCPAADQKWSETAMVDCFSMANMAPQDNALNTGAWKTLENKERVWAERDSAIIIVAGPIYEDGDRKRIGRAGVRVPGAFYKVMIAPYLEEPRGIAFVYPNMASPGNMENYVVTIRDVEKLTGLDFFCELPDDIEERVETVSSFRDWNRSVRQKAKK